MAPARVYDEAIEWLGFPVRDRVTGFQGVVSSISFDLYGCVQFAVTPPVNDKGESPDGRWFDIARVEKTGARVMTPPSRFLRDYGPAEKPRR